MNPGNWFGVLLVAMALILPLAALRQRHLPISRLMAMGLVWIAIFGAAVLIIVAFSS